MNPSPGSETREGGKKSISLWAKSAESQAAIFAGIVGSGTQIKKIRQPGAVLLGEGWGERAGRGKVRVE